MKSQTQIADVLRNAGLRATLPQIKVLAFFYASTQRHYTAEDVCRQVVDEELDISFGSIYRVLKQFVDSGLLLSGMLHPTRTVFELNDSPDHDHAICMRCGHIEEFCDAELDARQKAIGEGIGFRFAGHRLVLQGYCADCRDATGKAGHART